MGPPWRIDLTTHCTMSERSYHGATSCCEWMGSTHTTAFFTPVVEHWLEREIAQWVHPMKDQSDDPSHHERTILPWSYISLWMNGKHTYHSLCYTSCGALAGTRNSSMGPPWRIDPLTHCTISKCSYLRATSHSTMKDRSDNPSHHERTLLPRSDISLYHEGSIRRPITPWANALTTGSGRLTQHIVGRSQGSWRR